MTMSTNSVAALELKRFREQAGYSVRQLAAALRDTGSKYGRSPSSYAYYENDYKKQYLPVDLVDALVPLLRDRGAPPIGERQILALAGSKRDSLWVIKPKFSERSMLKTKIEVEMDLLAEIIRGVELEMGALELGLTGDQQARLVVEICRRVTAVDGARQPGLIEWEVAHACRLAKAFLQSDQ
jgi:transcriptional regulator with XRE-family HTH domain